MRAVVCHALSEDLSGVGPADVAVPAPGPGEALVRVRAAGVNFPDILMCQGRYQFRPDPPFIPGIDLAGEVAALGPGVTTLRVGDAVVGGARLGAFAQYALAPAEGLLPKPSALTWAQAAAYPAAYLTAYVALVRRARLQADEWVLVHGAAGGVGLACVDVARLLGARVIATSADPGKLARVVAYGNCHGVLSAPGFREEIRRLTDGKGADVIVDPVGGDVFDESTRCIAFDGRLLVVGFASGRIATLATNIALIKGFSVMGVRAGEFGRQFPGKGRENLRAVHLWADQGLIRPVVSAEVPLEQARAALDLLGSRRIFGKAVVIP